MSVGLYNPFFVVVDFSDQAEARRNKVKQSRLRREERQKQKREELLKQYAKEDDAAAAKTSK